MVSLRKKIMLMLIGLLLVFGVLIVEPCGAPVTTPANPIAAPDVSVEIHHNPIWHPPEDHTDPYTGEVLYSTPGGYSQNGTIVITIKNRPFTPYTDANGNYINVYYTIFLKALSPERPWTGLSPRLVVYQSNSDYTVITFTYSGIESGDLSHIYVVWDDTLIDFRVQAVTGGYFYQGTYPYYDAVYEGEGSAFTDFSITLPNASDKSGTITPNVPTPSNTTPETSNPTPQHMRIIIIVSVCVIIVLLSVIAYQYKQRKAHL